MSAESEGAVLAAARAEELRYQTQLSRMEIDKARKEAQLEVFSWGLFVLLCCQGL